MKEILITLLIVFCLSVCCNAPSKENYQLIIDYDYYKKERSIPSPVFEKMCSQDSLYLFFESGFMNDKVVISSNRFLFNKVLHEEELTTDNTLSTAGVINAGALSELNSIEIKINNSNQLVFNTVKGMRNIFAINKKERVLNVRFLKNVPYYE